MLESPSVVFEQSINAKSKTTLKGQVTTIGIVTTNFNIKKPVTQVSRAVPMVLKPKERGLKVICSVAFSVLIVTVVS